jgi:hypothetical protein
MPGVQRAHSGMGVRFDEVSDNGGSERPAFQLQTTSIDGAKYANSVKKQQRERSAGVDRSVYEGDQHGWRSAWLAISKSRRGSEGGVWLGSSACMA